MLSIFDYFDYRKYLNDFYLEKKRQMPYYSLRLIGHAVGMDSGFLIRVLQGTLHISVKKIDAFVKVCKLSCREAVYFEALVNFNKAKSDAQRKVFLEKLLKISGVKSRNIEPFQYEFFQKWYYSAVWSLIQMQPRPADYAAIAALCEPAISEHQARESIELLKRLGLIRHTEAGALTVTDEHLSTGEKWESQAIAGYQLEMLRQGEAAIRRMDKKNRDVSTVTITIPEESLDQLREMTAQYRKSLMALAEELPGPDRAFQVNIQIFPITKKTKDA
ncbi:MAG: TIGR02147 family protein, partial [Chitinivibrionales bacterium]|nr:TIGR02147 family protein [Chitinivibrionales bacterium]